MVHLLKLVKKGIDNPIKQSNQVEFLHLERLVNEGYIKATRFEPLVGGLQFFDAKLTSKGESCLENKVEPFPLEQTDKNVWTMERRIQIYGVVTSVITLGIVSAEYLKSLG
ncbi:hypothetical protein [Colwellia sp. 20A7]|uniref:hypothetical protein n=1 Tax=Colwellia sp. 20A7 TaxID=2689569 RepID=UPI00135CF19F|nr:hypothetical protein [Colwellia sp. 20A7]